ncbi:MAG: tetratricopeptide repeat protein [Planctomycetes bacterium]|nr:tetratricopeptide repeat protein [Planctomycetota bacterium]
MSSEAALPDFDDLWDFSNPAETESKFRDLLPDESDARFGGDWHGQLLTQIARTQGLQREFDAALQTLDKVDTQWDDAGPVVKIRSTIERGRVYNSSAARDKARPLFESAWDAAREADADHLAIDAAHMLAIVESPAAALNWNQTALLLAEASADPRAGKWTGSLYNNIGWTHHGDGDFETALDHFEKALACRVEEEKPDDVRVARWCVARCLRSLGRIEEALAVQQELQEEQQAAGSPDGYVFEELAECKLVLGRSKEARADFTRAYTELSQDDWLADNEPARLARLKTMGEVC